MKSNKSSLYLNANIIYSEILNKLKKFKKDSLISELNEKYSLVTSILTRMEIIQNLHTKNNLKIELARKIYIDVIEIFDIYEINSINKIVSLNDAFIDKLSGTNLDFKDALHLAIAKKLGIMVCTHDKKMRSNYSFFSDKEKFYDRVFKPEELI